MHSLNLGSSLEFSMLPVDTLTCTSTHISKLQCLGINPLISQQPLSHQSCSHLKIYNVYNITLEKKNLSRHSLIKTMTNINPVSRFSIQIKQNAIFSPMHKTHIEGVIIFLPSDYRCKRFTNVENVMDIAIFNHISSDSYPSSIVKPNSRDYARAEC